MPFSCRKFPGTYFPVSCFPAGKCATLLQTNGLERIFSKMSEQDLEKSAGFVVQLRGFATPSFSAKNSTVFEIYTVLAKIYISYT